MAPLAGLPLLAYVTSLRHNAGNLVAFSWLSILFLIQVNCIKSRTCQFPQCPRGSALRKGQQCVTTMCANSIDANG